MKITATLAALAALIVLTACASAPSDTATSTTGASTTSTSSAAAPAAQTAAAKPAPANASAPVAATVKTKRVCEAEQDTGSRLKRPRCRDVPEGNEKAYTDDVLREKEEELRSYTEGNALRSASPL